MIYGLLGLLLASVLLTWVTKPSNYAPVPSKRRKKKNKLRSRDARPYLKDEPFTTATLHQNQPAGAAQLPLE